jgi:hypothetical protein
MPSNTHEGAHNHVEEGQYEDLLLIFSLSWRQASLVTGEGRGAVRRSTNPNGALVIIGLY